MSVMALHGLVRRKLAQSLTIPAQPVDAGAARVSVIGRGINGLLQAVMLRLANYQVTVYGGNQENDGTSHNCADQYLAIECNRAGITLFEKLIADNQSLAMDTAHLMNELEALLQRSGVEFVSAPLSLAKIAELSREHCVVTATRGENGHSIVYCGAYHRIATDETYCASATRALVWACLVQEVIQAKLKHES
ncbi:hypothetical protein [Pseudomonas kairouanensis]|uniref:hypothetical protein n=1 Tax=Pseudomonas kairouanensis TaxID=2293832 RepID=UPI001EE31013|nr:hypothetical protein [Pseudomonas kairouanensis]